MNLHFLSFRKPLDSWCSWNPTSWKTGPFYQYHSCWRKNSCWCPGAARSIDPGPMRKDLVIPEYSGFRTMISMGLFPDTQNCGLRMRRECRERFPRHRLQRKSLVSDPGMHQGTCVMHVPWCMPGSITRGGGENVPGITDACATRNVYVSGKRPMSPLGTFPIQQQ